MQRIHAEIAVLKEQALQAMVFEQQQQTPMAARSLMSPVINRFIEVAVGAGK